MEMYVILLKGVVVGRKNELRKARRAERKAKGVCTECAIYPPVDGITICQSCSAKASLAHKRLYAERKENGLCSLCFKVTPELGTICATCSQKKKDYRRRLKEACYAYYGTVCNCCKLEFVNPIFLSLDHVNNDGNKHRRELGSKDIYLWAIENKFPNTLQMLCHNCNMAKALNGGICPHQEIK